MLKIMNDLPDNVLGVSAEGKVTAADYETVLIPAIAEKLKMNKKLRILYQISDNFDGFEFAAMVDDAKIGIGHPSVWEKMAVVSDHHLINSVTRFFSHFMLCEIKVFKTEDMGIARTWIAEPTHTSWIQDELNKVNKEFPLSGGETNEDLAQATEHPVSEEHIESNFPLSGGQPG